MRKFTKEHNELTWLFPDNETPTKKQGEKWFDFYEKHAQYMFDAAHDGEEVFTKDDLIDAFMKGASVSQQYTMSSVTRTVNQNKFIKERVSQLVKEHKRLVGLINVLEVETEK